MECGALFGSRRTHDLIMHVRYIIHTSSGAPDVFANKLVWVLSPDFFCDRRISLNSALVLLQYH